VLDEADYDTVMGRGGINIAWARGIQGSSKCNLGIKVKIFFKTAKHHKRPVLMDHQK
jgi:hypothetical protein